MWNDTLEKCNVTKSVVVAVVLVNVDETGRVTVVTLVMSADLLQSCIIMAVLYVVQESHYVLRLYFILLLLLFSQTLFFEVTDRIPFILSHNIRSRCNLITHRQKFVELYPPQKNHPKTPKNGHFGDQVRH